MKANKIIELLDKQSPRDYALDYDNVGLLVGRQDKEVTKIMITLDLTTAAVDEAVKNGIDMVISHHPMIFKGVKSVTDESPLGRKILTLIENGITYYAMHTNFDSIGGMGKNAAEILGLTSVEVLEEVKDGEGIGIIGELCTNRPMKLSELCNEVKATFGLQFVMLYTDEDKEIKRVAIVPGSGKSCVKEAILKGADCMITGDFTHHEGIDAVEAGLPIIDATHYGLEKIFIPFINGYLSGLVDEGVAIVEHYNGVPFEVI